MSTVDSSGYLSVKQRAFRRDRQPYEKDPFGSLIVATFEVEARVSAHRRYAKRFSNVVPTQKTLCDLSLTFLDLESFPTKPPKKGDWCRLWIIAVQ
jgi:hypothetical protein